MNYCSLPPEESKIHDIIKQVIRMIDVVAALIKRHGKILIARRSTGDPNVFGKWEFPGGKVKDDENEGHAIEREIKEEFELDIKAKNFIANNIYEYPNKTVNLKLYECDYISGVFKLHDHSEYIWADVNELMKYDFAPADVDLIKYIK